MESGSILKGVGFPCYCLDDIMYHKVLHVFPSGESGDGGFGWQVSWALLSVTNSWSSLYTAGKMIVFPHSYARLLDIYTGNFPFSSVVSHCVCEILCSICLYEDLVFLGSSFCWM